MKTHGAADPLRHKFRTRPVLEEGPGGDGTVKGLVAACSCGWVGERTNPPRYESGSEPYDHAEREAVSEWEEEHFVGLSPTRVPQSLLDQIRDVKNQLDRMVEDRPLAVLAAVRVSEGLFATQAREAALQATLLGHTWDEIAYALGLSKEAAWDRYAKLGPPASG